MISTLAALFLMLVPIISMAVIPAKLITVE
jgi:hypothetical protein